MLAVAVGSIVSSRVTIGVLMAWNSIVAPLLVQVKAFGSARDGIIVAATQHLAPPSASSSNLTMATSTGLAVIVLWIAVPFVAGGWWTERRDA